MGMRQKRALFGFCDLAAHSHTHTPTKSLERMMWPSHSDTDNLGEHFQEGTLLTKKLSSNEIFWVGRMKNKTENTIQDVWPRDKRYFILSKMSKVTNDLLLQSVSIDMLFKHKNLLLVLLENYFIHQMDSHCSQMTNRCPKLTILTIYKNHTTSQSRNV